MTLVLADGEARLVLARVFTCPVILLERVIRTTFVAFPEHTSSKTLLGVDFLANANLVINIPRMKFSFCDNPDLQYDFYSEDNSENDASINLLDLTLRKDEAVQLDEIERTQLQAILEEHRDVFEENNVPTPFAEHCINSTSETPIAVPPYRMSFQKMDVLKSEVKSLLEKEIIEECDSPYAAPTVLVTKKDGTYRMCVDYRRLNSVTVPDRYPLPRMDNLMHAATRTVFMSTLDLKNGYHQVSIRESDRDKTAFITPFGIFRFNRMALGLRNAPPTFQRLIDRFRSGLQDITILAYLDDMIILSENFQDHLEHLRVVLERLSQFKLCANRAKCIFVRPSVKYLGHLITPAGIAPDPDKISAISRMCPPRNVKHVLSFLQTCSWFSDSFRILPKYPSPYLTSQKKYQIRMGYCSQQAFLKLKELLTSSPILRQVDFTKPSTLKTDASSYALGACLLQGEGTDERPVEYASRLITPAERNYTTTGREALAIVYAIEKFRGYVENSPIIIKTDHQPLRWLMSLRSPKGRLARWALELQGSDLRIEYIPGKSNRIAYMLSRPPCDPSIERDCEICTIAIDVPRTSGETLREEQLADPNLKNIISCFEASRNRLITINIPTEIRHVPGSTLSL
ncbi:hypothetical protein JTB14_008408 [Gonioctena quinquepunctata]|nr:hypothetical protein JTB14_008408 [Gonioctena quinquepunctata]